MNLKTLVSVLVLLIIGGAVLFFAPKVDRSPDQDSSQVVDFQTCLEAGFPILDTFPPQCRTPDGRTWTEDEAENPEVIVETPKPGDLISSPLKVKGKARGSWYFEANLPVTLKDQNGNVLVQKGFQAKGEWMTEDYVEFEDTLTFVQPATEFGVLVIEKDNASGLPEHDASFAVPVRFR